MPIYPQAPMPRHAIFRLPTSDRADRALKIAVYRPTSVRLSLRPVLPPRALRSALGYALFRPTSVSVARAASPQCVAVLSGRSAR